MATKVREQVAVATPSSGHSNPLISHEKLRQLYSTMLKCRLLEERTRILEEQAGLENDRSTSVGMEATAVGAAIQLRPEDTLAPSQHDFISSYIRGVPLSDVVNHLYWCDTRVHHGHLAPDDCGYAPLNIVLPTSTVAAQWAMCNEVAFTYQRKKSDNVVMVLSSEASLVPGAWNAALSLAGQRSLPIVFVRQPNLSAGSVPVKLESTGDAIRTETMGHGFPGITVDAQDAVAMYRVAQEAVERARSGGGPTLIDAQTFPENRPTEIVRAEYRATDQVEKSVSNDPIAVMERYLTGKGLFSDEWKNEIASAFNRELDAAIYAAEFVSCGASA